MAKPVFPYFTVLYMILIVLVIYWFISLIRSLMTYGCGRHRPSLVLERFSSDGDSAKQYFTNAADTIEKYSERLDAINRDMETIRDQYDEMQHGICYIMNQVDDGITGNYINNVPEHEYKLPASEQAERKAKRKTKATTYLTNMKKEFSAGYNNSPLVECFDAIMPDEQGAIDQQHQDVLDSLNNLEITLQQTTHDFETLKNTISDKQIAVYYTSLAFTDKHISKIVKQIQTMNEGFDDSMTVLNFAPPTTQSGEPSTRLPIIGDALDALERNVANIKSFIQVMTNTIVRQKALLKKSTLVVNDSGEQQRLLDTQAAKIRTL
jgi:predicted transcriptional regulator